jgi:predicted SnoaL-like aldol condensation-catalyzing enzyme
VYGILIMNRKKFTQLAVGLTIGIVSTGSFAQAGTTQQENKQIVTAFYELAFNQHKPAEAARKYVAPPYTQHNPTVADGPEGFNQFAREFIKEHPNLKVTIFKTLADGDLVVLHVNIKMNESDRGLAVAEFFRLKDKKIVEHWDVMQPVPIESKNSNTMF